ncbi:MAG: alpha/beta hydrolase [Archangium sp.]
MPTLSSTFSPARGLSNGHAQSLFGVMARPKVNVPLRRVRRDTPDGDFVDLDFVDGVPGAPTLLLLHGLEGSSASGYMQLMLRGCWLRGWTGIAMNQRGCSGELNRLARAYSSGDFRDLSWLVPERAGGTLFAAGFSLGASVLLNFLARDANASKLTAAAAVSAPYDLALGAQFLDSGTVITKRYLAHFLPAMKARALAKAPSFPREFDVEAISAVTRIRDFDHLVTAAQFGFSSAEDYYAQCSAGPQLRSVKTRTLLLSSLDDALAPPVIPPRTEDNPALDVLLTERGGHVGFVEGSVFAPRFWAETRVFEWFERFV